MFFVINKDYKWVLLEDGGFVYNPENGSVEVLNSTATLITRMLEEGLDLDHICDNLVRTYPQISKKIINSDLKSFIDDLYLRGYICKIS
ncbi:MAG: hypothetical protein DDT22_00826 [candidate division WS2 bacterium]|nr:hypothetical protein [Candidatus Lithacetigena glycinireducens]